ncbi:gamma-glutamyltransferase, partial [Klebsiella pneumoniae]
ESNQTTHYSVVDKDGNAVAVTYTLNTTFGTGIVAGESGILLNNQMDDFSAKPSVPNVYGLVGGDANAVGPNKRPLSSMSPTIVVKDGKTWLVTGSPGGSR